MPEPTLGRRIVVGIDGSDSSISALRSVCEWRAAADARVDALTAWQWPMSLGSSVPLPTEYDPEHDAQVMLDALIEPLKGEFPEVSLRSLVAMGHPAEVLIAASAHADLLVVGSRGHGRVAGLVLGSVSQACVTHADCSVLVVRDPSS